MSFDPESVRADFPALSQLINGVPLVYFDNASTAQKPRCVIAATVAAYEGNCANIHRGVHTLSARATETFEAVRDKVLAFVNARAHSEIVFTKGTTEAINLVAQSFGRLVVGAGDEVLVSELEHHSNLVPWQLLCAEKGAVLKRVPMTPSAEIDADAFEAMLSPRVKVVALTHVSNAFGTVSPIAEMVAKAHRFGAAVLVDGAQAVCHGPVDVQAIGCDFYCFSAHKLFGPTGVGVLFGKASRLASMPPWQGGGDMITSVRFEQSEFAEPPHRFEAGTPNIAGVMGMGAAIDYVSAIGWGPFAAWERRLLVYATEELKRVDGVHIFGDTKEKAPILSFSVDGIHPHDVGTVLDSEGVAVRTGLHCAEPAMRSLGLRGTVRASLAFYNTEREVDVFVRALRSAIKMFR
ncbi:MAG: cysteine desulfurase [Polyangiaceae bacterium]|nr:cysteine desulfurase [Polyangiaceae bacterium]